MLDENIIVATLCCLLLKHKHYKDKNKKIELHPPSKNWRKKIDVIFKKKIILNHYIIVLTFVKKLYFEGEKHFGGQEISEIEKSEENFYSDIKFFIVLNFVILLVECDFINFVNFLATFFCFNSFSGVSLVHHMCDFDMWKYILNFQRILTSTHLKNLQSRGKYQIFVFGDPLTQGVLPYQMPVCMMVLEMDMELEWSIQQNEEKNIDEVTFENVWKKSMQFRRQFLCMNRPTIVITTIKSKELKSATSVIKFPGLRNKNALSRKVLVHTFSGISGHFCSFCSSS
ncbi:hypothetical protein RFI_25408 [Reticulomyxa filosa]|uniref:Uncharacterized protein n=1 Tax=Reticulomyxa filosa TaxID=46433 RepID=X6MG05_RETFI|nr:hypothetical protein RFI_25408 [Reticulomyxa filosa]|eukprot:ETO11965.1 hypothetical protein RFI_25408 [Reticulomyxa filosa]